jgi:hypothetical protein
LLGGRGRSLNFLLSVILRSLSYGKMENFFCPEDGDRMFIRNVNKILLGYMASHP